MTRKKVSTTYKREYSPERSAQRPSVMRSFDANYNYREYRRAVEHGHQRSPFVWDDWEYELESDDSEPTQQTRVIGQSSNECITIHTSYLAYHRPTTCYIIIANRERTVPSD